MDQMEFAARAQAVRGRLYRVAYPYLNSRSQAVDAVDEAVYQAFLKRHTLRNPDLFETWLIRIVINVCLTELRRRKLVEVTDELPERAHEVIDRLPLREAIQHLEEDLRAVIVLRYFTGLTLAETAETLGVPVGTVSTRQRRALALLRLELEEDAI